MSYQNRAKAPPARRTPRSCRHCSILSRPTMSSEGNSTNNDMTTAPSPARWRALVLLSLAELLGMSLWFSAAAVIPALRTEWALGDTSVSWLTIAVQLGFVCGTLLSAFLNLPDVISVRYLFTVSAFAGALSNAAFGAY